jgi:soluble lytic murein transglycosylase
MPKLINRAAVLPCLFIFIFLLATIFSVGCVECSDETGMPGKNRIICPQSCVLSGKSSLETGDFDKALIYLTSAYDEMPWIGDYILYWRADAFAGKFETDRALEDLAAIRKEFPDSPLIKKVRMKEIELLGKSKANNYEERLREYMTDYPSDNRAKYAYAVFLKNSDRKERARALFREVFASSSSYSKMAAEELSDSDIRAADLLKKGKNLNKAWHYKDSEKYFRKALLKKDSGPLRREISEGIALSLFRQKKYKEAASQYAECDDAAGRARSFYRAGDMENFKRTMALMLRKNDSRVATLMLAYGSKKRRSGDSDGAISIFNDVLAKFPSAKEEALWQKGWTLFRSGEHKNAIEIFDTLHKTYGGGRYLYWRNRALEKSGDSALVQTLSHLPNNRNNNFYFLMSALRGKGEIPLIDPDNLLRCGGYVPPRRIETLDALGFKKEMAAEIAHLANNRSDETEIVCLSSYLHKKRDFKTSIELAVRVPFREDLHELYYPLAYFDLVDEASRANGLDPLLALSVMREESRFAANARSVAGALGLMQLMPQTASRLSRKAKVSLRASEELYNARTNVLLGTYYLASLIRHFGSAPPAIASYNAGEDRVKEWLSEGKYKTMDEFIEDIPYDETRNYVKKVMTSYLEYLRRQGRKEMPALLTGSWNL